MGAEGGARGGEGDRRDNKHKGHPTRDDDDNDDNFGGRCCVQQTGRDGSGENCWEGMLLGTADGEGGVPGQCGGRGVAAAVDAIDGTMTTAPPFIVVANSPPLPHLHITPPSPPPSILMSIYHGGEGDM